jgi:small subunit ribosomal protein S16
MLTIRLIRTGKKNAPSFRIVLVEKTAPPKSGKFLEILGNYNPRLPAKGGSTSGGKEINLKPERIKYWLSQGVQTSETVHNLLVREGIIKGPKIKKKIRVGKKRKEAKKEEKEEKEIKGEKEEIKEKVSHLVETKKEEKEIEKEKEKTPVKGGSLPKDEQAASGGKEKTKEKKEAKKELKQEKKPKSLTNQKKESKIEKE